MCDDRLWDLSSWIDSPIFPFIVVVIFYFTIIGLLCWLGSRRSQNSQVEGACEDTRNEKDD